MQRVCIMKITDKGKEYECFLMDDGTLDTVISVNGQEHRFSTEYAATYRDAMGAMTTDGFYELAYEAIDAYETALTETESPFDVDYI